MDATTALELLQKLNAERTAYLENLSTSTELLSQLIASSGGVTQARPRLTADTLRRNTIIGAPQLPDVESVHRTASAFSGPDDDSASESDESLFVQTALGKEEYTIEGLKEHIRNHKWQEAGKRILLGVLDNEKLLQLPSLFPTDVDFAEDRSHLSHSSIYDIGDDGVAYTPISGLGHVSRSLEIWDRLKSVNMDDEGAQAVGKLIYVREPSPLLYAAVHYTMNKHFDMDEIFENLVHHDPIFARPHDPLSEDDRKRRTFLINLEYFTVVGTHVSALQKIIGYVANCS